jgi:hypothetical protein
MGKLMPLRILMPVVNEEAVAGTSLPPKNA